MTKAIGRYLAALLFSCCVLLSQNTDASPIPSRPSFVLYHFLRSAAAMSRQADTLDKRDGTGRYVRHALSQTLGISDSETAAVFSFALDIDSQFRTLDSQATNTIVAAKAGAEPGTISAPPPELLILQAKKNALTSGLSANLAQHISRSTVAAIHVYLEHKPSAN